MNQIQYIRATENLIPLFIENREAFLLEYWGMQDEKTLLNFRDELRKYLESDIPNGDFLAWLAMIGEECIAAGGMKIIQKPGSFRVPNGRSGYIMNMYTKPEYRRQGIGKEILERLIQTGKDEGITFFELHATSEGEPLYVANGFVQHKEPTYRMFV